MAITKQTALNEILVRLNNDGSVAGAHVVEIEHLTDTATGQILSSRLLSPRGITASEVGSVIGSANAGLLEQIDRLTADLVAMTTDRNAEKAAKDAALSGKASAETQRDNEAAAKDAALEQVATLTANLAAETAAKQEALTGKTQADQALSAALAEKSALEAQITALNDQLHPVDVNNFPILSAVQVRLALLGAGITFSMVDAVIDALPPGVDRDTARTYWEYAVQFQRSHPFIGVFAGALGLSDQQVDAMWRAAADIR